MAFESDLVLRAPLNASHYILERPLVYRRASGQKITVPAGFETDLASVPRVFWRIMPRDDGKYRAAAVIHDYAIGQVSWDDAATIFDEALKDNGTGRFQRSVMVRAVRMAGAFK